MLNSVELVPLCLCAIHILLCMGSSITPRKCPLECICNMDEQQRYQTICTKGGLNKFPVDNLDSKVQIIIIQGPRNSVTTGNSLRRFPELEVIRIVDSNVPVIGAESLWGLQHLKVLDFSKNNITLIMQKDFRGQNNLLELDLSKNKIINIASSTFCNLTELRRLNLAENFIGVLVQRIFFMLNKLKYLNLSRNPLQDLPPDVFRDVPQLKVFECRNCHLKKINPQFYNLLPQLSELDLGKNEFKFLDKEEFRDVEHLTKLLLDGNQLSVVVDELFHMQKKLKHLDLSHNRLAKVPNTSFLSLTNLTFLDLSYNKLVRLEPQSVRSLDNLRTLNISGNLHIDLHEIRDTFQLLPHLVHLSIADIGVLPVGLLAPFEHLRYLNMSGNHLYSMSLQIIEPCRELEFLDLSRNQLNGVNENIALQIQAIRNVKLDNNPFICDECHMGKLINLIRQLQWKWDAYPICFLPKTLRGAEIIDLDNNGLEACLQYLTDEEQNAASTSHHFLDRGGLNALAILAGIVLVLVSIIITSLALCFSKKRARYYTREDSLNGKEDKCLEKHLVSKSSIVGHDNGKVNTSIILPKNKTNSKYLNGNGLEALSGETINTEGNGPRKIKFKFAPSGCACTVDELIYVRSGATSLTKLDYTSKRNINEINYLYNSSSNSSSYLNVDDSNNFKQMFSTSPVHCDITMHSAEVSAPNSIPAMAASAKVTTVMAPVTNVFLTPEPPEPTDVILPHSTALSRTSFIAFKQV